MRISDWSSDVCSSDLPRQHALHALFPRARAAVPILSGGVQAGGLEGAPSPLLLLWQQGGRREAQCDARNGRVEAVARRARSLHRHPRNVGQGDGGLFRAAEDMARRAEQGQAEGLVSQTFMRSEEHTTEL